MRSAGVLKLAAGILPSASRQPPLVRPLSPLFLFRNKGNGGERGFPPRRVAAAFQSSGAQLNGGGGGELATLGLSHMFQSFKQEVNRCLGEAPCSPWETGLCVSSYRHFKTRRSGAGPLLFFFFSSSFLKTTDHCKGHLLFCDAPAPLRRENQRVGPGDFIPEDFVTSQRAERAPGLRPGRGHGSAGRSGAGGRPETKEEADPFFSVLDRRKIKDKARKSKWNPNLSTAAASVE